MKTIKRFLLKTTYFVFLKTKKIKNNFLVTNLVFQFFLFYKIKNYSRKHLPSKPYIYIFNKINHTNNIKTND